MYERVYRFNCKRVGKKLRNMRIRNGFEEFFCLRFNLSNESITSALRPGLKTGTDFNGLL